MRRIPNDTRAEIHRLYNNDVRQVDIANRLHLLPCTVCRIVNEVLDYEVSALVVIEDNSPVCSHFACGHHLTPHEQLYGGRCVKHQEKEPLTSIINQYI